MAIAGMVPILHKRVITDKKVTPLSYRTVVMPISSKQDLNGPA